MLNINEIVTSELEWAVRWNRWFGRIPRHTKQVFVLDFRYLLPQEVSVEEERQHEILVDDVWPVFVFHIFKDRRAEDRVERQEFNKLR